MLAVTKATEVAIPPGVTVTTGPADEEVVVELDDMTLEDVLLELEVVDVKSCGRGKCPINVTVCTSGSA